jgi:hypothetical protein
MLHTPESQVGIHSDQNNAVMPEQKALRFGGLGEFGAAESGAISVAFLTGCMGVARKLMTKKMLVAGAVVSLAFGPMLAGKAKGMIDAATELHAELGDKVVTKKLEIDPGAGLVLGEFPVDKKCFIGYDTVVQSSAQSKVTVGVSPLTITSTKKVDAKLPITVIGCYEGTTAERTFDAKKKQITVAYKTKSDGTSPFTAYVYNTDPISPNSFTTTNDGVAAVQEINDIILKYFSSKAGSGWGERLASLGLNGSNSEKLENILSGVATVAAYDTATKTCGALVWPDVEKALKETTATSEMRAYNQLHPEAPITATDIDVVLPDSKSATWENQYAEDIKKLLSLQHGDDTLTYNAGAGTCDRIDSKMLEQLDTDTLLLKTKQKGGSN